MIRFARLSVVLLMAAVFGGSIVRAAQESPLTAAVKSGNLAGARQLISSGADVDAPESDGSIPLLWASYRFDVDMAELLLDAGSAVDVPNNYGVTPLLQASRTAHVPMMQVLLDAGADPNFTHTEGETPLMAASKAGSVPAVRLLLDEGAYVDAAETFQQQTALMWAAAEGHTDVVDVLLEAGANPDHRARVNPITSRRNADHPTGGFTALMWAARNGDEATVRRLVEGGADLGLRNGDGATATMIAIYNDRFDVAATLIELGSDPNDGSLFTAVEMRRSTTDQFAFDGSRLRPNHDNEHTALDLIAMLLERGADPHQWFEGQFHSTSMPNSDRFADTPYFRAAVSADAETLRLIASRIPDVDAPLVVPGAPDEEVEGEEPAPGGRGRGNANAGRTAAMVAMTGGRAPAMTGGPGYIRDGEAPYREPGSRKPEDAVAVLLEAGADPNAQAPDGSTLLHQAVRSGNLDIIQLLADNGADFDLTNNDGLTALDIAEGRRPEGAEEEPPAGRGGRGGRGGPPPPEVAALLRDLMGLPPAPEPVETPEEELPPLAPPAGGAQ